MEICFNVKEEDEGDGRLIQNIGMTWDGETHFRKLLNTPGAMLSPLT